MKNTDITAIESLRTFALANNEIAFAHLCTAALAGEEWAQERIVSVLDVLKPGALSAFDDDADLRTIRSTDTTRPDGGTARAFTF